jgi:hypothetical protein
MDPSGRQLAERRAKLAKLRGEIFVYDRDITSAPPVTLVDEFQETFGTADQQKHAAEADSGGLLLPEHKIFFAKNDLPPPGAVSDFENNALVTEASRRNYHKSVHHQMELRQPGPPAEAAETAGEDLGYQSSASSPGESKSRTISTRNTVIEMEDGSSPPPGRIAGDSLSQSLPEGFLKVVKTELAQSLGAIAERAKSRGIYDPGRLFESGSTSADEVTPVRDLLGSRGEEQSGGGDDTEREYFQQMTRLQGRVRDSVVGRSKSFQHFLHQSFSGETRRRSRDERPMGEEREGMDTVGPPAAL